MNGPHAPLPDGRLELVVTTSDRVDASLRARARAAAAEDGLPYVDRTHALTVGRLLDETARALLVFEADGVCLVDRLGPVRFTPGLAHLRIKQLDAGVREDMLLRVSELAPGDRVLDCTLGLAADAQVAARLVGPQGSVTGLEKSLPVYLLARHGLAGLPRRPGCAPIDVRRADAACFLREAKSRSYDVVLLDPMFERARPSSGAFAALRRHFDESPLTPEMIAQARRVARKAVVVKGSRYSRDLKKLGIQPLPARRNATVLWARLAPGPDEPGTGTPPAL